MAKDYVFTLLTSGENKRLRSIIPEPNEGLPTKLVGREGTLDSLDEGCCCGTCEAQAKSGGAGVTINDYTFPKQQKTLEFRWQAYSVPDKFTVYFCDEEAFSWGPSPDGGRVLLLKPQGCRKVTVKVEGEDGTVWDYTLTCYECLTCQSTPTTKSYSYNDSYPPGKWYACLGSAFESCANQVINAHIIEKFNRVQLAGRAIKAKVKDNSRIDNEGSIGGIYTVDNFPAALGRIQGDHDITDSLIIEDNDEDDCITAKIPVLLKNSNLGGPIGLAGTTIEWSCCPGDNCICSIPQDLKIMVTLEASDYNYYANLGSAPTRCPKGQPIPPGADVEFTNEVWKFIQGSIFNGTFELERWPEGDGTTAPGNGFPGQVGTRVFGFRYNFPTDNVGNGGYELKLKAFLGPGEFDATVSSVYIAQMTLFSRIYTACTRRREPYGPNMNWTANGSEIGDPGFIAGLPTSCEDFLSEHNSLVACSFGEPFQHIRTACPPNLNSPINDTANLLNGGFVSGGPVGPRGCAANAFPVPGPSTNHPINVTLNLSKKS